jgi:RNA polymerase sigma-70 factor (ECF subfamily)
MISQNSFSDTLESSRSPTDAPNLYVATNPEAAHDAELVRRFNTGDEDAFPEIVARHHRRMFSVALSHLRNRADAEEIAQDTFVRAYRGLARFRGDSSLSCWLHRIAFNLSRNRYGYYARRHRNETSSFDCALGGDNDSTLGDLITCDVPDPAREETNREFLDHVIVCMQKLSDRQREILTLRSLLDHSYEEIAKSLNLSIGTVKSRIARARKNLRGHLAQIYGEFNSIPMPSFKWFEPNRPDSRIRLASALG